MPVSCHLPPPRMRVGRKLDPKQRSQHSYLHSNEDADIPMWLNPWSHNRHLSIDILIALSFMLFIAYRLTLPDPGANEHLLSVLSYSQFPIIVLEAIEGT